MSGREAYYIQRAFEQNWIAPLGENVDRFEAELSAVCHNAPVTALSSGTAAIHLALVLAGVKAGDVVLCQSFTFCASANPICYLGATPVFVGSEATTWNMSPTALEEAIQSLIREGRKPKALIFVHLYGTPAMVDELMAVASKYDITVIEDAAESLGSLYKGRQTGTFGHYGILSFNGNKIITTSGGGALISRNAADAKRAWFLATQARDHAPYYLHSEIGYNYRLSNICAGIGRGQLEVLPLRVEQRRRIYSIYREQLAKYSAIQFLDSPEWAYENKWLSAIVLDSAVFQKVDLMKAIHMLNELNVECRPLWHPLHMQPVFRDSLYYGSRLEEDLFARGLCLPSASSMTEEQQQFVIEALPRVFGLRS